MNTDLLFLEEEFGLEPESEGTTRYGDVDYQAALTADLKHKQPNSWSICG